MKRGTRHGHHIGTYAQVTITVLSIGYLAYLIYVGATEDGMRIWIVAMHWAKRLERVVEVLVVSAVASFGLVRSWRWAWWLAALLDAVVIARCVYEIGWAEWTMYATGRLFETAENVAIIIVFFAALVCLLVSKIARQYLAREQELAADFIARQSSN